MKVNRPPTPPIRYTAKMVKRPMRDVLVDWIVGLRHLTWVWDRYETVFKRVDPDDPRYKDAEFRDCYLFKREK